MRRVLLALAPAVLAFLVPVEGGAAAAAPVCRGDALGNVVCRDLPAAPEAALPGAPRPPVMPRPRPERPLTIPAERTDSFGTVRPGRGAVTRSRPFGQRPRPGAPAPICRTDSFGNVACP